MCLKNELNWIALNSCGVFVVTCLSLISIFSKLYSNEKCIMCEPSNGQSSASYGCWNCLRWLLPRFYVTIEPDGITDFTSFRFTSSFPNFTVTLNEEMPIDRLAFVYSIRGFFITIHYTRIAVAKCICCLRPLRIRWLISLWWRFPFSKTSHVYSFFFFFCMAGEMLLAGFKCLLRMKKLSLAEVSC